MVHWAHNKMPASVKRRYFELLREGHKGAAAARRVGVSTSCGSLWFLDAGGVIVPEPGPVSSRFLSQDDRIAIADGLQAGDAPKAIAVSIGKSFQTVYREIARNRKPDGSYQPWWAHNQALRRRQRAKPQRLGHPSVLLEVIDDKLTLRWSPQQISRFLVRSFPDDPTMRACPEIIYQALFAGRLGPVKSKLRTGRSCRKRHRRGVPVPNKIKNMNLIRDRPVVIEARRQPGHWEGDLIIGRHLHSAIGTLVERVSRFVILIHLPHGYKAPQLRDALTAQLLQLAGPIRRSVTWDQGREMAQHAGLTAATGVQVWFCEPHSPWQRGTNENTNGLIRQYFPKHTDLSVHTAADLLRVASELNQRPRLILGDRTPEQVLQHFITTNYRS
jgi:IS30 family transposase